MELAVHFRKVQIIFWIVGIRFGEKLILRQRFFEFSFRGQGLGQSAMVAGLFRFNFRGLFVCDFSVLEIVELRICLTE